MDFFRPGRSILHKLDPRAKLLLLVPLFVCFFLPVPPLALFPFAAALMLLVAVTLGPRELLSPLRAILPVLIFICLLTPPFHRDGTPLIQAFGVPLLTSGGLRWTLLMLVRFLGITFGFFAVVRTISLDELVLSLRWFGLPYVLCLVVIIALRTIPTLAETWHNILNAHRLRAGTPAPGRRGGTRSRARPRIIETYFPALTSVLIEAVKGIPVLAMVLESRGFGRRNRRTSFVELKKGRLLLPDFAVCIAVAAVFIFPAFIPW
jgi:energy-coupling factor transport system permease protein